jgi:hypothetical protein
MPEIPDLRQVELPPNLAQLIPQALARRLQVLPLARFGSILIVARSPEAKSSIQELRKVSGHKVKVLAADPDQITAAIDQLYGGKGKIPEPGPETSRRMKAAIEADEAGVTRVDTVPILQIPGSAPARERETSFMEIEEIVGAIPIGRAEYEEQARTPFGQLYRAWDDLFRDGKVIKASRVG